MDLCNSLPNDKILARFKLKAFADDKLKVANMMIFVLDGIENIMEIGENAGLPAFSFFSTFFFFRKASLTMSSKIVLLSALKHFCRTIGFILK